MCVANVETIKEFINIQSVSVPQINENKKTIKADYYTNRQQITIQINVTTTEV